MKVWKLVLAAFWSLGVFVFFGAWLYLVFDWVFGDAPFSGWHDVLCLVGVPIVGLFCFFMAVGSLLDALGGEPRGSSGPNRGGPVILDNVTIDGQPGQRALVFTNLEDLLRTAESVEAAGGPKRPLLYTFQHVALREAAFENHPELVGELSGARTPFPHPLLHFRSKAHLLCEDSGLLKPDHDEDDAVWEAENELFMAVSVHPRKRGGFTAHVVAMPRPEFAGEAHLTAIVHKDDEPHEYMRPSPSTRYFTLEKADDFDRPLLCEWFRDGSRKNYGVGPVPEVDPFADAVLERVLAGVSGRAAPEEPSASGRRS